MRYAPRTALFTILMLAASGIADDDRAKGISAKGRILSIKSDPNQLTVYTSKGEVKLEVDDQTSIRFDDKKAKFEKLRVGDAVQVRYEKGEEKVHRALELRSDPTTARDLRDDFRKALKSAGKYAYREKVQFQNEMAGVVRDLDAQIEKLSAQAKELGEEAQEEYGEQIKQLNKHRDAIGREMRQAGEATAETWEDAKSALSKAAQELGDAVDQLTDGRRPEDKK